MNEDCKVLVEAMKKVRANLAAYGYPNWGEEYWDAEEDIATIDAALSAIDSQSTVLPKQPQPIDSVLTL